MIIPRFIVHQTKVPVLSKQLAAVIICPLWANMAPILTNNFLLDKFRCKIKPPHCFKSLTYLSTATSLKVCPIDFVNFSVSLPILGNQCVRHHNHQCLYGCVYSQQTTSLPLIFMNQNPGNTLLSFDLDGVSLKSNGKSAKLL